MRVTLEYGKTGLQVELPTERVVRSLGYKNALPLADPAAELARKLAAPTGTRPLAELARGRQSACVVICDITRPVPNRLILSQVLPTLEEAGIPRTAITILVATGLHRPATAAEIVEMVGAEIAANYAVENHHGTVLSEHTYLGDSPAACRCGSIRAM